MTAKDPPGNPIKLRIAGHDTGKPTGFDSVILNTPGRWYLTGGGKRAFVAQLAAKDLRQVAEFWAADIGETLHHADWVITDDPAQVTTLGLMHDCVTCLPGVDKALAWLRDNPGGKVAVGQLWWAHSRRLPRMTERKTTSG